MAISVSPTLVGARRDEIGMLFQQALEGTATAALPTSHAAPQIRIRGERCLFLINMPRGQQPQERPIGFDGSPSQYGFG